MTLQRKKEIGVVAITCIYSAIFWLGLGQFLRLAPLASVGPLILVVLAAVVWVVLIDFTLMITPLLASTVVVALFSGAMVAVTGLSVAAAIGAVLLMIFLATAKQLIMREVGSRVRYSTTQFFYASSRLTLLGLIIAVASLSLPHLSESIFQEQVAIPEDYLAWAARPFDPIVARLFPGFSQNSTVDDLLNAQLASQLPPGVTVPEGQKVALRAELARQLGAGTLSGRETFSQLAAQRLNVALKDLAARSPFILALAFIIIIFLALKALLPLLAWPVLGGLALLMMLARTIGLTYLVRTEATIERLTL